MKKKSFLSGQQTVRRKKKQPKNFSGFFRAVKTMSMVSVKVLGLCVLVASISLLFICVYQYLASSSYMRLKEVRISGVDKNIKKELFEISGLDNDELSLLTINMRKIKLKMESHPWIRKVELEKSFPNLLLIHAEKEVPFAIVALDKLYYINRWGEPFKELEYSDDKDFPVITGILPDDAEKKHHLEMAASILSVFETEKGAWSMEELSELHIEKNNKIALYSTSMPMVLKMGYSEVEAKKKELGRILGHLRKNGQIHMVKTIDLDYSDRAVVSFNDAG